MCVYRNVVYSPLSTLLTNGCRLQLSLFSLSNHFMFIIVNNHINLNQHKQMKSNKRNQQKTKKKLWRRRIHSNETKLQMQIAFVRASVCDWEREWRWFTCSQLVKLHKLEVSSLSFSLVSVPLGYGTANWVHAIIQFNAVTISHSCLCHNTNRLQSSFPLFRCDKETELRTTECT